MMMQPNLVGRDILVVVVLITLSLKSCWGQSKKVVINDRITYFDVTTVKDITWETATDKCASSGMNLCMMKDLCIAFPDVPRSFIRKLPKDKYVPVGDAYNDWVYLGPRRLNRCKRMTEVAGPPLWKGKGCKDAIKPSKVFQRFCQSSSGIYCCQRPNKMADLIPHPVPVFISRYEDKNGEFYSFSLNEESKEEVATKNMKKVSKGLRKLTLMSAQVDGKYEDPIYFCSKQIPEGDKLVEYFHVSNKWCNWKWKMNFYLYGSYAQLPDSQRYEANTIGFKAKFRSGVSVNGTVGSTSNDFAFYGPKLSDGTHIEFYSEEVSKCSNETVLLTSKRGTINSQDFQFAKKMVCRWKIRAPSNGVVKIKFVRMKMSEKNVSSTSQQPLKNTCNTEKLQIFGYGQFCGNALPAPFVTIDNEIEISYVRKLNDDSDQLKSEFLLSYETIVSPNGLVRKRVYDPRLTWNDASKLCSDIGKGLCKANDICQSTNSQPFYGVRKSYQWTPIIDEFNNWLQIGNGNGHTCRTHNDMFGPPLWGISRTECNSSNEYSPCPKRDYVYCCKHSSSMISAEPDKLVDVMIYSNIYKRVIFTKYIRRGIDNLSSFDNTKVIWTIRRKATGDYSMIRLSPTYTTKFDKTVYFCQREIVPSILQLQYAYSMMSQPCERQGWKYLYHLYGMSKRHPLTVKYYVGVYEKRPHHTRVRSGAFPRNFQKENSYIIYSYRTTVPPAEEGTVPEKESSACDGSALVLTAPTVIMSPGYPKSYRSQADCKWIIQKPINVNKDGVLRLTVKELDLEDPVDVLKIRMVPGDNARSNSVQGEQVRTLSGIVGQLTMKTTGYFELNFTSDESISRKGFRIDADIIGSKCGGEVRTSGDLVTSPNYPSRYPTNTKCQWSIEAPSQNYDIEIRVTFLDLTKTENCADKVVISSDKTASTLCGQDAPENDIFINGSAAVIQFHSSSPSGKPGKGFALQVIFIERPSPKMLQCGVQSIPFRSTNPVIEKIVGGSIAKIQNFPWMMHIEGKRTYCAGTLISNAWVLSAAHCFIRTRTLSNGNVIITITEDPAKINLIAGRQKWNVSNRGEQIRWIQHLQFRDDYLERLYLRFTSAGIFTSTFTINDIVLLKMNKEITVTSSVRPICLPYQDVKVGDTCYIAGWGTIDEAGTDSVHLRYTKAPILKTAICNRYWEMYDAIIDSGLCAGYPAGGTGMCNGDSGGPLFCRGKYGNYYIQGITSWSVGCARKELPGVYTRVYHYNEWIRKIIESDIPIPSEGASINYTVT